MGDGRSEGVTAHSIRARRWQIGHADQQLGAFLRIVETRDSAPKCGLATAVPRPKNKAMSSSPYVLCVDPTRLFHKMVAQVCAGLELQVRNAFCVVEAMAEIAKEAPMAIVAGYQQRDFSASSLVAALKCDTARANLPIAVMSSSAEDGIRGVYQPDRLIRRDNTFAAQLDDFLRTLTTAVREAPSTKAQVLLVEDSATMQRLAGSILYLAGCEVTIASHGEEALAAVAASSFDLVLMDIEMPVMDGREAIKRMRASGLRTPVVALTGHESSYFADEARLLGFDGMCAKPIRKATLLETVTTQLGRHSAP